MHESVCEWVVLGYEHISMVSYIQYQHLSPYSQNVNNQSLKWHWSSLSILFAHSLTLGGHSPPIATQYIITLSCPLCQVTTTTKTIREVQYIGPDGQPLDYIPGQDNGGGYTFDTPGMADYQNYGQMYPPPLGHPPGQYNRPPTPPTPSERSHSPGANHRIPGRTQSLFELKFMTFVVGKKK